MNKVIAKFNSFTLALFITIGGLDVAHSEQVDDFERYLASGNGSVSNLVGQPAAIGIGNWVVSKLPNNFGSGTSGQSHHLIVDNGYTGQGLSGPSSVEAGNLDTASAFDLGVPLGNGSTVSIYNQLHASPISGENWLLISTSAMVDDTAPTSWNVGPAYAIKMSASPWYTFGMVYYDGQGNYQQFNDPVAGVGTAGDWVEMRLTVTTGINGIDGIVHAQGEVRNITTGGEWIPLETANEAIPVHAAGFGADSTYIGLGLYEAYSQDHLSVNNISIPRKAGGLDDFERYDTGVGGLVGQPAAIGKGNWLVADIPNNFGSATSGQSHDVIADSGYSGQGVSGPNSSSAGGFDTASAFDLGAALGNGSTASIYNQLHDSPIGGENWLLVSTSAMADGDAPASWNVGANEPAYAIKMSTSPEYTFSMIYYDGAGNYQQFNDPLGSLGTADQWVEMRLTVTTGSNGIIHAQGSVRNVTTGEDWIQLSAANAALPIHSAGFGAGNTYIGLGLFEDYIQDNLTVNNVSVPLQTGGLDDFEGYAQGTNNLAGQSAAIGVGQWLSADIPNNFGSSESGRSHDVASGAGYSGQGLTGLSSEAADRDTATAFDLGAALGNGSTVSVYNQLHDSPIGGENWLVISTSAMADGDAPSAWNEGANEPAYAMKMSASSGHTFGMVYYDGAGNYQQFNDDVTGVGYADDWVEMRLTVTTGINGITHAQGDVRNITTGSDWIPLSTANAATPVHSAGFGLDNTFIGLGLYESYIQDNLTVNNISLPKRTGLDDDFESYRPPLGGSVDLIDNFGWVEADGLGGTGNGNTYLKVCQGCGFLNTDAFFVGWENETNVVEHAAQNLGKVKAGDQVTLMVQVYSGSYADIWIGERMADGTADGAAAVLQINIGEDNQFEYTLDKYPNQAPISVTLSENIAGSVGQLVEVRLTMLDQLGPDSAGIDSMRVEARNAPLIGVDAQWEGIGITPLIPGGLGDTKIEGSEISLVLGGKYVTYDNLKVNLSPETRLSYGHKMLVEKYGLQLAAQVAAASIDANFDSQLWEMSNLTTVDLVGSPYPATKGIPADISISTGGAEYNVIEHLLMIGYGPYMDEMTFISVGGGEHFDLFDLEYRALIKVAIAEYNKTYPWALVHTEQAAQHNLLDEGGWAYSLEQIMDYIQDCKPDLLRAWDYPFNGANDGGSPKGLYGGMEKYRLAAKAGHDLSGAEPILSGFWMQLWGDNSEAEEDEVVEEVYYLSQSEIRLNNFAAWAFGFKSVINFIYHFRVEYLKAVIFDTDDTSAPNDKFDELADTNAMSLNLGPALIRLVSTDLRMIMGKHFDEAAGIVVSNEIPEYRNIVGDDTAKIQQWSSAADPYITDISVTNNSDFNNQHEGDVIVGYFKPLHPAYATSGWENDIYFMVVNGLSDSEATPAQTQQTIHLEFDFGDSGISSLKRLSRVDGEVEVVDLTHIDGSQYRLDLQLDGGTGDLFKFNNEAGFVSK